MNKRSFEELEADESDTTEEYEDELQPQEKGKEKEPLEPPKKKFRINARQLALTYARTGGAITKEECFDQLREKLGDPSEFLIAQESHKVVVLTAKDCYHQYLQERYSRHPKEIITYK